MRVVGLGLALVFGALGACNSAQLGGERRDAGGSPPIDAATTVVFPDASAGSIFPPDASTGPVYSAACWASSLPAQVQPTIPTSTVMASCAAAAPDASTDWTYPQNPSGTNGDDRRYIVGRWQVCDQSISGLPAHAGIEFGANGRWRMLALDATTGNLVAMARSETTSGYYYMLGNGQLDLDSELPGGGMRPYHVTFAAGMDAMNFNAPSGPAEVYARTAPSPLNGADNPPPSSAGPCSIVGDWEIAASGPIGAQATVFSFDAAGNFVVGSTGTNICDAHGGYGTYALSPGMFQLTTNIGLGGCQWWFTGGFQAAFDPSCNQLSLNRVYDNCTGGRIYFNEPTTLLRLPASCCDAGALPTP